jgi:adenylate cyclase
VVSLLNGFFRVVVDVVEAHGGAVNKFQGDAALCVFWGARVSGAACGRRPRCRSGAAPAARHRGWAVAGNVGGEARFEYTVIGDPVNEAARLCELAKARPQRVLASQAALEQAGPPEDGRWRLGESVTLRGRQAPTRLATVEERLVEARQ